MTSGAGCRTLQLYSTVVPASVVADFVWFDWCVLQAVQGGFGRVGRTAVPDVVYY